jgi:hypothetical protein
MRQYFRQLLKWAMVAGALLALGAGVGTSAAQPDIDPNAGRPDELVVAPETLVPLAGGQSADAPDVALSPVRETPRAFSYLFVKWQATDATSATFRLELRASADGANWSEWREVLENPDLYREEDGADVHWSQTIYSGPGQRFWQARVSLSADEQGQRPELKDLVVSSVDPDAMPQPAQTENVTEQQVGKPAVISRTSWGCPDGQGSRVPPAYYRVKHLVVHHTADQNSLRAGEANWAARVRATWSFHTHTRGWGDVGYNYLIDPNGVIYEGRAGGDDAVGFHDTGNYGSMGVVLIGTYSTVQPRAAAVDSLVSLLAWKAGQRSIDPLGRSYYYGCDISSYCKAPGAIIDNIAGHRFVNPTTSCPGDSLVGILPTIRNRVKDKLNGGGGGGPGQGPDNGDLVIDELEDQVFARSNASWYDAACGYGGHSYYTFATDNAADSTNSATWRPNIREAGTYRVYAHIPQGCGLFDPPYATAKALYKIRHANGSAERSVDQNTAEEWVDLGLYTFNGGTDGAVELYDHPGEPYDQRKVIFFDSVKWVRETAVAKAQLELVNVRYSATTLNAGELLKVTFTVKNVGNANASGQEPTAQVLEQVNATAENNGYAYDEGECFLGDEAGSYPTFPKETGRFRVLLGPVGSKLGTCKGDDAGYPWRWGLSGQLAPGQQTDVIGYVRFRSAGSYQLQAGGIQEYVDYFAKEQFKQTIAVGPEKLAPMAASYDGWLSPLATVYRLGEVPDNLLARTQNPVSITRGATPVGSFVWYGAEIDWDNGGPFELKDNFVIEQTRVFYAPKDGLYSFKTLSDDGSWLWVDGKLVANNYGLHATEEASGTVQLKRGMHVLAYKYFERDGTAAAGYWIRHPGQPDDSWEEINEAVAGHAREMQGVFVEQPALLLAADDMGGSGVERIRYSLDGTTWLEQEGGVVQIARLVNGSYTLRYQAIDRAGNQGPVQALRFVVDTRRTVYKSHIATWFQ